MSDEKPAGSLTPPHPDRRSAYVRLAVLVLVIVVALYAAFRFGIFELSDPSRLATTIRRAREVPALPLLFVLGYTIATVVGIPGTVFTLAGGAIFGTLLGSLFNWAGATLGALGAYALVRWLGSDAVRQFLGRRARALDALTSRASFATLFRLRLIPVVPFNAFNFAAGFAPAPFRAYALSTALGIIPGTVVYTYFADSIVAGVMGARQRALVNVAIAALLLILLSFVPRLAGHRHRPHPGGPAGA